MAMIRFNRLLKKVFGRPRCATLIQSPIPGRKKDSSLRDFGFENCVSSADFRVFQQPASGKVAADSKTNLARSGYGVVIRAGSSKPDISSVEAFKRALLNAKSITYLPVLGVPQLIERLGLKEAIASKTTMPNSDISSELVAKGEIELGVVAITQAFTTPGIELVGPLPPEIQMYTNFGGAVSAASKAADASRDLLKFLKGPAAVRVIKDQGMEAI
jgi:molybdate transport system substrate-binding protein